MVDVSFEEQLGKLKQAIDPFKSLLTSNTTLRLRCPATWVDHDGKRLSSEVVKLLIDHTRFMIVASPQAPEEVMSNCAADGAKLFKQPFLAEMDIAACHEIVSVSNANMPQHVLMFTTFPSLHIKSEGPHVTHVTALAPSQTSITVNILKSALTELPSLKAVCVTIDQSSIPFPALPTQAVQGTGKLAKELPQHLLAMLLTATLCELRASDEVKTKTHSQITRFIEIVQSGHPMHSEIHSIAPLQTVFRLACEKAGEYSAPFKAIILLARLHQQVVLDLVTADSTATSKQFATLVLGCTDTLAHSFLSACFPAHIPTAAKASEFLNNLKKTLRPQPSSCASSTGQPAEHHDMTEVIDRASLPSEAEEHKITPPGNIPAVTDVHSGRQSAKRLMAKRGDFDGTTKPKRGRQGSQGAKRTADHTSNCESELDQSPQARIKRQGKKVPKVEHDGSQAATQPANSLLSQEPQVPQISKEEDMKRYLENLQSTMSVDVDTVFADRTSELSYEDKRLVMAHIMQAVPVFFLEYGSQPTIASRQKIATNRRVFKKGASRHSKYAKGLGDTARIWSPSKNKDNDVGDAAALAAGDDDDSDGTTLSQSIEDETNGLAGDDDGNVSETALSQSTMDTEDDETDASNRGIPPNEGDATHLKEAAEEETVEQVAEEGTVEQVAEEELAAEEAQRDDNGCYWQKQAEEQSSGMACYVRFLFPGQATASKKAIAVNCIADQTVDQTGTTFAVKGLSTVVATLPQASAYEFRLVDAEAESKHETRSRLHRIFSKLRKPKKRREIAETNSGLLFTMHGAGQTIYHLASFDVAVWLSPVDLALENLTLSQRLTTTSFLTSLNLLCMVFDATDHGQALLPPETDKGRDLREQVAQQISTQTQKCQNSINALDFLVSDDIGLQQRLMKEYGKELILWKICCNKDLKQAFGDMGDEDIEQTLKHFVSEPTALRLRSRLCDLAGDNTNLAQVLQAVVLSRILGLKKPELLDAALIKTQEDLNNYAVRHSSMASERSEAVQDIQTSEEEVNLVAATPRSRRGWSTTSRAALQSTPLQRVLPPPSQRSATRQRRKAAKQQEIVKMKDLPRKSEQEDDEV
eukprot:m.6577 g.6577  ORF g.6577 m.6577 type:complete len:1096 (+) comp8574_c0_seq2:17-3304(+)